MSSESTTTMISFDVDFINFMNSFFMLVVTSALSFYIGRRYERLIQQKSLIGRFFKMFNFNFTIDERVGTETAHLLNVYTQIIKNIDISVLNNYLRETITQSFRRYDVAPFRKRSQTRTRASTDYVATKGSDNVDIHIRKESDSDEQIPAKHTRTYSEFTPDQLRSILTGVDKTDKVTGEVTGDDTGDDTEKVTVSDGGLTSTSDNSDSEAIGDIEQFNDNKSKTTFRRRIRIVKK